MTKQDAIRHACTTVGFAYNSIGDFRYPSDGFCDECEVYGDAQYQNKGDALRYVRIAVLEKLRRDGFTPKAYRNGAEIPIDQFISE